MAERTTRTIGELLGPHRVSELKQAVAKVDTEKIRIKSAKSTPPIKGKGVDAEREKIIKAARTLTEAEKYVLLARQTRTLQEIGYSFEMTRERVRQIEQQANKKLLEEKPTKGLIHDPSESLAPGIRICFQIAKDPELRGVRDLLPLLVNPAYTYRTIAEYLAYYKRCKTILVKGGQLALNPNVITHLRQEGYLT